MLERDGYPPGVPCWIDTAQPDPEAGVDFYGGLFGWEFEDRMPSDSPGRYFVARLEGRDVAAVGSQLEATSSASAWNTYMWVDSADDSVAKVIDAGGSVLVETLDVLDAGRMAVFSDPAGAVFSVWQAREHKGAQIVNNPGTWNWSDLNTRDPESAKAFYGAVFGWKAETLDLGGFEATMWRVPGYGEHLETIEPGLRRRQEGAGAPPGFADAIGWLMPMTRDQFPDDVGSHWSITFAVDDTDAVADRAAELGGEIMQQAYDIGDARVAVVRDPQGATFTVSKYDPS